MVVLSGSFLEELNYFATFTVNSFTAAASNSGRVFPTFKKMEVQSVVEYHSCAVLSGLKHVVLRSEGGVVCGFVECV